MLKGFKEFILRGNVVDLAVAVVIGAAFTAVVTALVADLITPLIAAIAGKPDFSALKFTVHHSTFKYGAFINAVVSFLLIAAAIYFFIVMPLNKLAERRARKVDAGAPLAPEARAEDVILLEQIRDILQQQNGGSPPTLEKQSPRPHL
ncbi:MAG TPA: large-conductance mechanosensitive channel protein MscL [Jatrophihabitans sp.]|nr:large-conductance mechanosensitive channel protein MscL [Jatrophihabitans sp.]